jgi:hypothetical protein
VVPQLVETLTFVRKRKPIKPVITAHSQLAAARRVALKMGRRLRCSSEHLIAPVKIDYVDSCSTILPEVHCC